jgi:sulfur carrier protein
MNLRINGNAQDIQDDTVLTQLIKTLTGEPDPQGVAVAVNGSVISRSLWPKHVLCSGDDIEILGAVSGG